MERVIFEELSELNEIISAVDLEAYQAKLSRLVGVEVKLDVQPHKSRLGWGIKFTSQELVGEAGVFSAGLKSLTIEDWDVGVYEDEEGARIFYASAHYRFELKGGGTNGMPVMVGRFDFESKKWEFVDACRQKI